MPASKTTEDMSNLCISEFDTAGEIENCNDEHEGKTSRNRPENPRGPVEIVISPETRSNSRNSMNENFNENTSNQTKDVVEDDHVEQPTNLPEERQGQILTEEAAIDEVMSTVKRDQP